MKYEPRAMWVYFIKPIGLAGPIKIGCSHMPADRLIDVMAWSPFKLELIGSVQGTMTDERFLHRCFSHLHSHAEWFHGTVELTREIERILAGGIAYARQALKETGRVRLNERGPESRSKQSASMLKSWAERKARAKVIEASQ